MRAGRAGGDHRVVGAFEAVLDRHIAGRELDDAAGHEERRHAPRSALFEHHTGIGDAARAADAGADEHAGDDLVIVALRFPAGVVERLLGRAHRIDDELVDLALLLWLHPLVAVVGAVGAVAARDLSGDARGQVGHVDALDARHPALPGGETLPGVLDAATERRHHAETRDDHTPHVPLPSLARQSYVLPPRR